MLASLIAVAAQVVGYEDLRPLTERKSWLEESDDREEEGKPTLTERNKTKEKVMDLPKQGKQNGADQGPHEHPGQAEVKMAHQVVEKFGALREAGEDGAGCDEKAMLTGQSDLEDVGCEQGEPKKS